MADVVAMIVLADVMPKVEKLKPLPQYMTILTPQVILLYWKISV